MPKVKLPRKSTNVDMTAMCDVAFLLLTFFILATKQKPAEVLAVQTPSSISAKAAPDKSILITLTADGRAFLTLGDETKKKEILENINLTKQMGLSPEEINKWNKQEFIGLPLSQIKGYINSSNPIQPAQMPGIPIKDTLNNEMVDWIRSVSNVYAGSDQTALQQMLLVKGDNAVLYPLFKNIKQAFKKNEIYKFRIVTNGEAIPIGSEVFNESIKS
ncbi:MAG TPA: biopolymer transporter ExbD [Ferruginibacter sp.]|jgi:biopolymer transport protein ExbD|nr:biopolymer transporter ExbD [Chitinophagaceae bacterium]HML58891.1 biopolymer transporter ExbD [Ferruginibacter sp.]HRN92404.1 biopolymer transporter ExbD [Ferruginibacter sp.]HRO06984.1 biopolymer transporter ExbD [Ferruginibacter sp.]HRO96756.1 biopolymer transporter ExbD [Ferruginibacter sp.]